MIRWAQSARYCSISRSSEFQLAVVAGVLDDDLVGSDGLHGVVETVAGAAGIAFHPIDGIGVDDGQRRPRVAVDRGHGGQNVNLLAGLGAERTQEFATASRFLVISGDNPGTGNGILAQLHRVVTL